MPTLSNWSESCEFVPNNPLLSGLFGGSRALLNRFLLLLISGLGLLHEVATEQSNLHPLGPALRLHVRENFTVDITSGTDTIYAVECLGDVDDFRNDSHQVVAAQNIACLRQWKLASRDAVWKLSLTHTQSLIYTELDDSEVDSPLLELFSCLREHNTGATLHFKHRDSKDNTLDFTLYSNICHRRECTRRHV